MGLGFEEGELYLLAAGGGGRVGQGAEVSGGAGAAALQALQDFAGAVDYLRRNAGHSRDLDAVAPVGAALHQLAQPEDPIALLFHRHPVVADGRGVLGEVVEAASQDLTASRELLGGRTQPGAPSFLSVGAPLCASILIVAARSYFGSGCDGFEFTCCCGSLMVLAACLARSCQERSLPGRLAAQK